MTIGVEKVPKVVCVYVCGVGRKRKRKMKMKVEKMVMKKGREDLQQPKVRSILLARSLPN